MLKLLWKSQKGATIWMPVNFEKLPSCFSKHNIQATGLGRSNGLLFDDSENKFAVLNRDTTIENGI